MQQSNSAFASDGGQHQPRPVPRLVQQQHGNKQPARKPVAHHSFAARRTKTGPARHKENNPAPARPASAKAVMAGRWEVRFISPSWVTWRLYTNPGKVGRKNGCRSGIDSPRLRAAGFWRHFWPMNWHAVMAQFWPHIAAGFHVLAGVLATSHALLQKRDTRAAIIWISVIWTLPIVGPLLYLALGVNRIRRRAIRLGVHDTVEPPRPGKSRRTGTRGRRAPPAHCPRRQPHHQPAALAGKPPRTPHRRRRRVSRHARRH